MHERRNTRRPRAGSPSFGRPRRHASRHRPVFDVFETRVLLSGGITFQFDDSHDNSGFFAANPQAMTVIQEAGQILGSVLQNSLAPINPDPGAGDTWTAVTFNPSDPSQNIDVSNLSVPADTIVVYVGGTTGVSWDGLGGPGGYTDSGLSSWLSTVAARGQAGALATPPSGFGPWGGSVSFNTAVTWDFSGQPGSSFLGVALHELCHVLGVGTAGSWFANVDAATSVFTGAHAESAYGGPVPLDTGSGVEIGRPQTHWAAGTVSDGQVALMTPDTGSGVLTPLDWAGLNDIGWITDHLAVTAGPPQLVTVGTDFGLTISAEDPDGQVDPLFGGTVTLNLASGSGGGTLGGTLTATAKDGVAVFAGLSLDAVASGLTIGFSSPGLPSGSTSAFGVTPAGQATHLVVTAGPPASVTAGSGFGLTVSAEDNLGNVDSSYAGTITLAPGNTPAGQALGGTTTARASDGMATFSGLTLDVAGGSQTLQAGAGTLASGTTAPFAVDAAAASRLVVTTEPPAVVLAGEPFPLAVSAEDRFGNVDPTFGATVSLAVGSGAVGVSLGGTVKSAATAGVATFPAAILDRAATGLTLVASGGGLPSVTTGPLDVSSSTSSGITITFDASHDTSGFFAAHPQAAAVLQEAGQILGSQLHDSLAAIVPDPGQGNTWTQTIQDPSNPSSSFSLTNPTIPANTVVVYVGGASATGVYQDATAAYSEGGSTAWGTLVATRDQSGTAPTGGSIAFSTGLNWSFGGTANLPAANQYDFLTAALQALATLVGFGIAPSWKSNVGASGRAFDGPHAEAVFGGPVPLQAGGGSWASGLHSGGVEPLMDGVISAGQQKFLTPLDWAGLADVGWTVDTLAVTRQPPAIVAAGSGFGLTVAAEYPDGQADSLFNGPVALTLGNDPGGGTLGGTTNLNASGGIAVFAGLTLAQAATGYTILATSSVLPSVTTTTIPMNVSGSGVTPSPTPSPSPGPTPSPSPSPSPTPRPSPSPTPTPSPGPTPTPSPSPSPTPIPSPPPVMVIGDGAIFQRKKNRKGKPVGKPRLTGFTLTFSGPGDPTAAEDRTNYQVDAASRRKGKKGGSVSLLPITGFSVVESAGGDSVQIAFAGIETFPRGGRITVSAAVIGSAGAPPLVFTVSPGGKSIQPG